MPILHRESTDSLALVPGVGRAEPGNKARIGLVEFLIRPMGCSPHFVNSVLRTLSSALI